MKSRNMIGLMHDIFSTYRSLWLLVFTGAVLLASWLLTHSYIMSSDIIIRLVCFFVLLMVLLWYQFFKYNALTVVHSIYYLLLIISFNPSVFFVDWHIYLPCLVFALDVTATIILYLNSYNITVAYRYYGLLFFSWLFIFALQPEQFAAVLIFIGLLLRTWPACVSFWWIKDKSIKPNLSLAFVLIGNISLVWDLIKHTQVIKNTLFRFYNIMNEDIIFTMLGLDTLITVSQIMYGISLLSFLYYCCKLLSVKCIDDIALYTYQAYLGLLMCLILQMIYLSNDNIIWYTAMWNNWFRLITPWLVGMGLAHVNNQICLTNNTKNTDISVTTSNFNRKSLTGTNVLNTQSCDKQAQILFRQFHNKLTQFMMRVGWLWLLLFIVLVSYLSTASGFWYFTFFVNNNFIFSLPLVNNIFFLGLGMISIFITLWWSVYLYQVVFCIKNMNVLYPWRYVYGMMLLVSLMIFQWLYIMYLWQDLASGALYTDRLLYAVINSHVYQWRYLYCVFVISTLLISQYLWRWLTWLERLIIIMYNGVKSIPWKIWGLMERRIFLICLWSKYLIFVAHRIIDTLLHQLVYYLNNGGYIKPGSAMVLITIYWSTILLLCYF